MSSTRQNIEKMNDIKEFDSFLDEQIEKNRKGDFCLTLLTPEGIELSDVEVSIEQIDHEFLFGICPNGHKSMTNKLACGEGKEAGRFLVAGRDN